MDNIVDVTMTISNQGDLVIITEMNTTNVIAM